MQKTYTVYCSTRRFDGDDPVKTKLTVDLSQLTEEEIAQYAIDSLVIKWQSPFRRKKRELRVPTEATYVAPKPGARTAPQMLPFDALVMACGGNKELALSVVNKAGSVEEALELFKAVLEDFESEGE